MGHENVDDSNLRDIFHHAAESTLFYHHPTIERHCGKNCFQLPRRIGHDSHLSPLAQIDHDPIRYRRMELRIDVAGHQSFSALGEAHINRREAVECDIQHAEYRAHVLLHAAALRADGDALAFEIGD